VQAPSYFEKRTRHKVLPGVHRLLHRVMLPCSVYTALMTVANLMTASGWEAFFRSSRMIIPSKVTCIRNISYGCPCPDDL